MWPQPLTARLMSRLRLWWRCELPPCRPRRPGPAGVRQQPGRAETRCRAGRRADHSRRGPRGGRCPQTGPWSFLPAGGGQPGAVRGGQAAQGVQRHRTGGEVETSTPPSPRAGRSCSRPCSPGQSRTGAPTLPSVVTSPWCHSRPTGRCGRWSWRGRGCETVQRDRWSKRQAGQEAGVGTAAPAAEQRRREPGVRGAASSASGPRQALGRLGAAHADGGGRVRGVGFGSTPASADPADAARAVPGRSGDLRRDRCQPGRHACGPARNAA